MEFKAKEIAEILGGTVDGNPEETVTTFAASKAANREPSAFLRILNMKVTSILARRPSSL